MVDQVFEVECWRLTRTSGSKPIGVPKPEVSCLSSCSLSFHHYVCLVSTKVLMVIFIMLLSLVPISLSQWCHLSTNVALEIDPDETIDASFETPFLLPHEHQSQQ
jgi:hypothetical protein